MTERVRVEQVAAQIQVEFTRTIREVVRPLSPALAMQVSDRLFETMKQLLAGLDVAFPSPARIDCDAIEADWRKGLGIGDIVAKHRCSKATAYRNHPKNRAKKVS